MTSPPPLINMEAVITGPTIYYGNRIACLVLCTYLVLHFISVQFMRIKKKYAQKIIGVFFWISINGNEVQQYVMMCLAMYYLITSINFWLFRMMSGYNSYMVRKKSGEIKIHFL